jgi:hypothetical protein
MGRGLSRKPLKFYRLWCGQKCHSTWQSDLSAIWKMAYRKGLAYRNLNGDGGGSLGPLTWIELGTRRYPRAKTEYAGRIG